VTKQRIGILGATSLVGNYLLELLEQNSLAATAFSRRSSVQCPAIKGVEWVRLNHSIDTLDPNAEGMEARTPMSDVDKIDAWISVAPIWVLPQHFALIKAYGIKRIVALSSTSVFVKADSSDPYEKDVALRLSEGEEKLKTWATANGIQWIILRPTLIYGCGKDKNVAEIANFIRRFGFFPLFGRAYGLRQPVHAEDVAAACLAVLQNSHNGSHAYDISGGETIAYRDMVKRIFSALGLRPRLVTVPLWVFRIAISLLHVLPRYRHWTTAMAGRMNQDLCFDHSEATRDFGYSPRAFEPFCGV